MSLRQLLRKTKAAFRRPLGAVIDRFPSLAEARTACDEMSRWDEELERRRRQYEGRDFRLGDRREVAEQLHRDGYAILRGVGDKEVLAEVKRELERELDAGTHLWASEDTVRSPGDLSAPPVWMGPEELARGQDYLRRHTNFVTVTDCLLTCL